MKTIKQALIFFMLSTSVAKAQGILINPGIFGQNAWFYDGTDNTATTFSSVFDGVIADVAASGVKYVRIGGADATFNPLYNFNTSFQVTSAPRLEHLINLIRANGMEPIIEVGYNPVCGSIGTLSVVSSSSPNDQATIAGNLVKYFNDPVSGIYKPKPIRYWIIANEPDLYKNCVSTALRGYGWDGATATASCTTPNACAGLISTYIKDFAIAMKTADPTIKIMGPELASFGNDVGYSVNTIMNQLISDPNTNTNSIMGKTSGTGPFLIDYISFHYYPDYSSSTSPRAAVIADPALCKSGFKNNLSSNGTCTGGITQNGLVQMINAPGVGRNISNLKIACTEFNLGDAETSYNESTTTGYNNMRDGNGNRSFLGGQWMADVFSQAMNTYAINPITHQNECWVEFMNFWSVKENGGGACTDGKGYMSACTTGTTHPYRSTYNHYKMLANYFKGTFYMGTVQSGKGDFKAFASKSCDGIYIMVLNQNTTTTINAVKINLNGTMPSTGSTQVGIQLGTSSNKVAPTTNILISHINPEETILIKCDPCGKPLSYKTYNKTMSVPDPFVNFPGYQRSCACLNANFDNTAVSPVRCSNTDTSSITHPRIVAPGKLEISDSMWVPNSIRVPNGATLTINNAEVVFSAGAKIYTDPPTYSSPGGQVIIMNSYLHGCDGASWQGITVSNHNDSGYVPITIQQSTIHDALVAVHADSVTGGIITASEFSNGATAMQLNNCKNFTIDNNSIGEYTTGIQTTNTMAGPSSISGNFITGVNTAISMLNDNHSGLTISCNDLYNYTGYGVHSTNCTLKNQGTALQGAGNIFTSSSLLLNNKFSHSGNNITYYTDPSYPFTLVSGIGMNASTVLAQADGCGGSSRMENESEQAATQLNITPDKAAILSTVPNPATEQAAIFFNLGKDNVAGEIVLTNVFGEIISRFKVNTATNKIDIDCTKMPNGIYFTSLLINGKIAGTKKMMIAR